MSGREHKARAWTAALSAHRRATSASCAAVSAATCCCSTSLPAITVSISCPQAGMHKPGQHADGPHSMVIVQQVGLVQVSDSRTSPSALACEKRLMLACSCRCRLSSCIFCAREMDRSNRTLSSSERASLAPGGTHIPVRFINNTPVIRTQRTATASACQQVACHTPVVDVQISWHAKEGTKGGFGRITWQWGYHVWSCLVISAAWRCPFTSWAGCITASWPVRTCSGQCQLVWHPAGGVPARRLLFSVIQLLLRHYCDAGPWILHCRTRSPDLRRCMLDDLRRRQRRPLRPVLAAPTGTGSLPP